MRADSPALTAWIDAAARGCLNARVLRHAHRLWINPPREPLERAFTAATAHGLFEVARIKTMALRELGDTFLRLAPRDDDDPEGDAERYRGRTRTAPLRPQAQADASHRRAGVDLRGEGVPELPRVAAAAAS